MMKCDSIQLRNSLKGHHCHCHPSSWSACWAPNFSFIVIWEADCDYETQGGRKLAFLPVLYAVDMRAKSPYTLQISIAVTISAADQVRRGITCAQADRKCVQKQIRSPSGESSDNLLSLERRDHKVRIELRSPPSAKRCKTRPIRSENGGLCAWLALNEAVCLPKWILPTPNHSISLLLSPPTPPLSPPHSAPAIMGLPRHQWSLSAGLCFTPLCH